MRYRNLNMVPGWYLLLIMALFVSINVGFREEPRQRYIDGDGSGHYAWLPMVMVYHTLDFAPVQEAERSRKASDYVGHNYHEINGRVINKFTLGTALCQLPGYLLASLVSAAAGLPLDGYNILYQNAAGLSTAIWTAFGLYFLYLLLLAQGAGPRISFWSPVILLLGTNLMVYTFITPGFSHAYSFSLIAWWAMLADRWFRHDRKSTLLWLAVVTAMIFLVRPVNILIVLALPVMAKGWLPLVSRLRHRMFRADMGLALLLFSLVTGLQFLYNYRQTGQLWYDGYQGEGFLFLHPHLWEFLFSFRKGWFIYTPLMLLIIPASIRLLKVTRPQGIAWLIFIVPLIYIFSSWWNWFYGDSMGMRPMVDYYSLMTMIIILWYIGSVNRKKMWSAVVKILVLLFLILNLLQTYQYATGIIHPDSMDSRAYAYVFGRVDKQYSGAVAGGDEYYYGQRATLPFLILEHNGEVSSGPWSTNPLVLDTVPGDGNVIIRQDDQLIYSPSVTLDYPPLFKADSGVYVMADLKVREADADAALHALVVVDITDEHGDHRFYKAFRFKRLPDDVIGKWREEHIGFKLPPLQPADRSVKFYVWNRDKRCYDLDDLRFSFYRYH